jgi:hypothetical protein
MTPPVGPLRVPARRMPRRGPASTPVAQISRANDPETNGDGEVKAAMQRTDGTASQPAQDEDRPTDIAMSADQGHWALTQLRPAPRRAYILLTEYVYRE